MAASKNLSKKEIEILSILAHAENPMTISDIVATNSAYTTNIVQPIIHKLSDLGLVEVDSIVFRKKSFARAFRIADNSKNVLSGMFLEEYQSTAFCRQLSSRSPCGIRAKKSTRFPGRN